MKRVIRNSLAIILGITIGSMVNMGLIMLSGNLIPPPIGADVTTMEGLKVSMHLFEPKHFLFPFLAHAIGTLIGAYVAARIAMSHKIKYALGVGFIFLLGGIANVFILSAPVWFISLDLLIAYFPMSWLGGKLATQNSEK